MNILEEEEIEKFFHLLQEHQVKFILVGGLAVNFHGYSRTTGDVDLWMEDSIENRTKLVEALKTLKIEGVEAFLSLPILAGYAELLLDNGIYVDFMADLQFFKQEAFDECYQISELFNINDTTQIRVLHINKLIDEKQKSSRPKDKDDAENLIKLYRTK